MAKSSIHIQKSVRGSVGHNSREHFSYSVVFIDDGETNELDNNQNDAYKIYRSELGKRSRKYTERTGQKLQKKTVTQLSAIVNLEKHHTLRDLEPVKKFLENKFGTKVFQMAIHRDEGKLISKKDGTELYSGKDFFLNIKDNQLYFDKKFTKKIDIQDYEIVKNYHAHIEMLGLDEEGNAIRQKMSKGALREMQDFTAKTLQMERGQQTKSYTKEQMKEIKKEVGSKKDYESTTLYAQKFNEVARELGYYHEKNKRKDTHKFKDDGAEREGAKRELAYDFKEMKAQIVALKEELNTEQRKELHALNRAVNKGEATIEDLQTKIETLKATNEVHEGEIKELRESVKTVRLSKAEIREEKYTLIKQNKSLQEINDSLHEELAKSEPKINSRASTEEIDAETKVNEIMREHLADKVVYDKPEKSSFFNKKEPKPTTISTIQDKNSFIDKVKSLARSGTGYLKDRYNEIKKDYEKLAKNYNILIAEIKKLTKEKSLYEEVAEDINKLNKRYVELSQMPSYRRTDEDEAERILIAKELVKPFGQRMREFAELERAHKKRGHISVRCESEEEYKEIINKERENSESKLFTSEHIQSSQNLFDKLKKQKENVDKNKENYKLNEVPEADTTKKRTKKPFVRS